MNFTDTNKIPGILLFIDFEKAFDTLEWSFLHQALEVFNFGPNIRKWVSVSVFSSTIKWFNNIHKLNVSPSVKHILFNLTGFVDRLDLLLLFMKHYVYSCKIFSKNSNIFELQTKLQMQWKIEHCLLT